MISHAYPSNDKPRVLKNYGSWDTHQTPDGLLTGYKCHRNYLKPQVKETYLMVQVTWFLKDKKYKGRSIEILHCFRKQRPNL